MRAARLTLAAIVLISVFWLPAASFYASSDMIQGLSHLTRISQEEAETLPEAQGPVTLAFGGERLPFDEASNTYFIPQSAQTEGYDGAITLETEPNAQCYLFAYDGVDKRQALEQSVGVTVYEVLDGVCRSSKVIFTPLPVLTVQTQTGEMPDSEDQPGVMSVYAITGGELSVERTAILINLRGNTSKLMPKKSYRVQAVNADGSKRNVSLGGLRSDDDWILNPMYSDASKIREPLAYALWDAMNRSGVRAASSRIAYGEVLFNGAYWGLYGLQERMDNKQVGGDKRTDFLYKIATNDRPTASELLSCADTEVCRAFELVSGPLDSGLSVWAMAAQYIEAINFRRLEDVPGALSLENAIDYGLWAMLTQAHDCHFKNQYLNCVYGADGYTLYKIPWDLNHTLGDVYLDDPAVNYTEFRVGSLVMDCVFEALVNSGDGEVASAIVQRWAQLRQGVAQEETLMEAAQTLFDAIQGPLWRDSVRWPECGKGEGNADSIDDIRFYFSEVLKKMDEKIAGLTQEEASE